MNENIITVWSREGIFTVDSKMIDKIVEEVDKNKGVGECWHPKPDATALYLIKSDTREGNVARTILFDRGGNFHNVTVRSLLYQYVYGMNSDAFRKPCCGDWECVNPIHQIPRLRLHVEAKNDTSDILICAPENKKFYDFSVKLSPDSKHLLVQYELLND